MSFSRNSNFNNKANFTGVKFGESKPVLEVELNELQEIQNEARAEIIRDSIPSGFTQLSDINYNYMATNPNVIKLSNRDSVAYVNGYKVTIPKDTVIKLNAPPEKAPREDLVFLEVWKEEVTKDSALNEYGGEGQASLTNNIKDVRYPIETSRRIALKWRIRVVDNVDFSISEYGIDYGSTSKPTTTAQGNNSEPVIFNSWAKDNAYTFYDKNHRNVASDSARKICLDDTGLFVAGMGDQTSKNILKTVDGYVYAIPMFRVYRRPSCGYMNTNEYNIVSPLCNPLATKRIVNEDKVAHSNDGSVEVKIKGKVLKNLLGDAGNCEDLSKWGKGGSEYTYDENIKLFGSRAFRFKPVSTQSFTHIDIPCDQTHKYFISAYSYINSYASGRIVIASYDYKSNFVNRTAKSFDTSKINVWQRKSMIVTGKEGNGLRILVGVDGAGSTDVTIDGVMLYDLTEIYGVGNEPTDIEQLERELPYVDGLQSSKPIAIKSVGKNLAQDVEYLQSSQYNNVVLAKVDSIKPSTKYTLSLVVPEGEHYYTNEKLFTTSDATGLGDGSRKYVTVTTRETLKKEDMNIYSNGKLRLFKNNAGYSSGGKAYDLQIEEGEVVTEYAPYKESQVILPSEIIDSLAELPNGVADEVDLVNKKVTKRIGEVIFDGSDDESWTLSPTGTNELVTMFQIPVPQGAKGRRPEHGHLAICDKLSTTSSAFTSENYHEGIRMTSAIFIRLSNTSLDTLDVNGVRAWLKKNPVTVYYELDTPIEYDISDLLVGDLYVNPENTTFITEQVSQYQKPSKIIVDLNKGLGSFDKDSDSDGIADGFELYHATSGEIVTTPSHMGRKSQKVIVDSKDNYHGIRGNLSVVKDHKYFISWFTYIPSSNSNSIINLSHFIGKDATIAVTVDKYIKDVEELNKWLKYSLVVTATDTSDYYVYYRAGKGMSSGDIIYFSSPFIIDLTSTFGVGNEPNVDWCNKYLKFGDNHYVQSPANTTSLGASKNGAKSVAVSGNTCVVPSQGVYNVFYQEDKSQHVPPEVEIKVKDKTLLLDNNTTTGSLDLTDNVGYKKHSDGARNKALNVTINFDTPLSPGSIGTYTASKLNDNNIAIGDFLYNRGSGIKYYKVLNIDKLNSKITILSLVSSTIPVGIYGYDVASDRIDSLYSDIIDTNDVFNLRHQVSLVGYDYNSLLEESFDKLLRGDI